LARTEHDVLPTPDGLERAFGDDGEPPVEVELGDGRTVTFRGRIDRVDRSPDGRRVVVYDYKTGRPRHLDLEPDPVDAGRSLQLPVYALAARQRDGADEASAYYWYTAATPDQALVGLDLDDAHDRFVDVVETIVDGVEGGCFPAYPGGRSFNAAKQRETFESCAFCEFDELCPVDRATAWDRKHQEDEFVPFLSLELEDPDDEGAR
jgi:hypothetical protein